MRDFVGGARRLMGELLDLGGDQGESLARLVGLRHLDDGVEGEKVGLPGGGRDQRRNHCSPPRGQPFRRSFASNSLYIQFVACIIFMFSLTRHWILGDFLDDDFADLRWCAFSQSSSRRRSQPSSATPAPTAADRATTLHGGAFQTVRATKPAAAKAKSRRSVTALVKTGE